MIWGYHYFRKHPYFVVLHRCVSNVAVVFAVPKDPDAEVEVVGRVREVSRPALQLRWDVFYQGHHFPLV